MHDPVHFKKHLGNKTCYHDFLVFFQQEIEKKGWEAVLNEYLFQRDERADDMLVRMFMGQQPVGRYIDCRFRHHDANC